MLRSAAWASLPSPCVDHRDWRPGLTQFVVLRNVFMQPTTRFRSKRSTARQLASLAVIAAAAMLPVSAAYATKKPPLVVTEGIKAYRLCTGPD
ncbi:Uncharacterized protein ALO75_04032, partial [Pseudomonas syringae pv. coryli]